MGAAGENAELAKTILDKFYRSFLERNPQLRVYSAHLHMDEATPHLHIDFIPFTTGSKRGLSTRVSLKQALADQGISLVPVLFIRPVGVIRQTVEHRVKTGIILPALDDVQCFLMNLPADAVPVGARRRQQEPQWLLPGIAAALGHDIIQGAGRLGMKLIKDAGADVQAVLGGHFTGQHLINASCWLVDHSFGGRNDLDALAERRGLLHHINSNIKHDSRLLTVAGAGVNLRPPLIVIAEHIQGNGSAELTLSVLLRNLNVGRVVLPHGGIIVPDGTKHIPDDLFLPGQQLERLPVEFSLGMLQALNELRHPAGFRFTEHPASLPSGRIPSGRRWLRCRHCWHRAGRGWQASDRTPSRRTA